ncbi:MAG: vWA domain-containing protein [Byssovorax sp.]
MNTLKRTWMVGVASVMVTSGVALGACSSGSGVEIPVDPTTAGETSATSGGGGAGGAVAIDGGGSGGSPGTIDPGSACATSTVQANLTPVDLFILFDRSASMAYKSKWSAATAALTSFFQSPSSAGLGVALRFFPEDGCDNMSCNAVACGQPLVPFGRLLSTSAPGDAQEQALVAVSSSKMPPATEINGGGGTPLTPALSGAESWATNYLGQKPGDRVAVILVSDGEVNGCDPDPASMAKIVASAHAAGVDTFAVGLAGYFEAQMNALAAAGGTGQAFFIGKTDVELDLLTALQTIQQKQVSCALPMPQAAPGKVVDPTLVNVDYTPEGGVAGLLGQVKSAAACGAAGGWYYNDPAAPTQIVLCPNTCATVQADPVAKIEIILGCLTQPAK